MTEGAKLTAEEIKKKITDAIRDGMAHFIGAESPPGLAVMQGHLANLLAGLNPDVWVADILGMGLKLTVGAGSAKEMETMLKGLSVEQIDYLWESFGDGIPFLKFEWSVRHDFIDKWRVASEKNMDGNPGTEAEIEFVPKHPLNYIHINTKLEKDEDGEAPDPTTSS